MSYLFGDLRIKVIQDSQQVVFGSHGYGIEAMNALHLLPGHDFEDSLGIRHCGYLIGDNVYTGGVLGGGGVGHVPLNFFFSNVTCCATTR